MALVPSPRGTKSQKPRHIRWLLYGPPQASMHGLEYTSLLDDVLAVIKLDLATQNDKADPFLGNVPNMQ